MNTQSRAIASLLGLAIGDALGAPVEFKSPGEFEPVTDYRHSHVWNIPPGYWTDDTSMALCLADSIIARDTVDAKDLLERFGRWYTQGENSSTGTCFDIGTTTRTNIQAFQTSGVTKAPDLHYQSGNGGIMRLAPVAIRWWHNITCAAQMAVLQSQTTHGSAECASCASELATLLTRAIQGQPVKVELTRMLANVPDSQISNSGRAMDTLMAAKWCVANTSTFEQAVLRAVNLGGDADTIGAVTGQLAGACYGTEQIPERWMRGLFNVTHITEIARQLYWGSSV